MSEFLHKKRVVPSTLKRRKQEIEQCLVTFGLTRDSYRHMHRVHITDRATPYSQRLRMALESLGPVFSLFGLYMSSRVDLLPIHACLTLAAIPDWAEATPIVTVREVMRRELGCWPEAVYSVFEEEPYASYLTFQSHRALLNNGKLVTVKIVHPVLREHLETDLELLPVLQSMFTDKEWCAFPFAHAIMDFRHTLQWHSNLLQEVKVFEALAADAQGFEMLRVPMIYKDLCSAQVMTLEQLPGLNLEDTAASLDKRGLGTPTMTSVGLDTVDLARRLCLVWLRQALLGEWFPVAWHPKNIRVLPNKQIAFSGGEFASLPPDAKSNLWNYLIAASTEDPDKACSWLLKEVIQAGQPFDEDELRHRFRGIVPFRDGGWENKEVNRSLAEHLFVQWKLVSERGLRPQRHLLCFYRGLFQITANAQRFAPYSDSLLEGLQDVRTIAMLAQFQEMLGLTHLSDNLDKYAAIVLELPQKLDAVLTLAAEGSARRQLQGTRTAVHPRQTHSSAVVIALLLLLGAFVLLSHHLAESVSVGVWLDRISAMVFVLLGALLLRAASHTR
jgi:ubiquinone biosynthesis protein